MNTFAKICKIFNTKNLIRPNFLIPPVQLHKELFFVERQLNPSLNTSNNGFYSFLEEQNKNICEVYTIFRLSKENVIPSKLRKTINLSKKFKINFTNNITNESDYFKLLLAIIIVKSLVTLLPPQKHENDYRRKTIDTNFESDKVINRCLFEFKSVII